MKKKLSLLLVFIMITVVCTNVSASEVKKSKYVSKFLSIHQEKIKSITGNYHDNIVVKKITDLSGNEFELIETGASGYYIFDTVTGRYIEYSENAPSPYLGKAGELVYLGPKSYYIKNNQSYSHTVLLKEKEKSIADLLKLQNEFSQRIHQCRQRKDDIVLTLMSEIENSSSTSINVQTLALTPTPTPILIDHHEYVEDATFPSNQGGTCGYVAACLVLNYWNKTYPNADVIDNVFLNGSGNLLTSGYTLQDKLLSYGYPTATTGLIIRNVLYTYCTEYGIGANISYSLSFLNVLGSLQNNRPVM